MSEKNTDGIGRAWMRVSLSDATARLAEIERERMENLENTLLRMYSNETDAVKLARRVARDMAEAGFNVPETYRDELEARLLAAW